MVGVFNVSSKGVRDRIVNLDIKASNSVLSLPHAFHRHFVMDSAFFVAGNRELGGRRISSVGPFRAPLVGVNPGRGERFAAYRHDCGRKADIGMSAGIRNVLCHKPCISPLPCAFGFRRHRRQLWRRCWLRRQNS